MKIVRQRDLKDCGICSLLSIIRFYGGDASLEQLRLDAKVTALGTTALNLLLTGQKYGFDVVGLKFDSLDDKNITLPAIAHLNLKNGFNHYVVLYKITNDKVWLMDPSKGKVVKTRKDFLEEASGVLLVFYPKRKITIMKKESSLLKIFCNILLSEKKLFFLSLLMSALLVLTTIASSYYFKIMLDSISANYGTNYLKIFVLIFGVIVLFKLVFEYLRKYYENYLNKNIDVLLNSDFITHIFNLPLDVVTSRTSGEVITRVGELVNIKSLFTEVFINYCIDFLLLLTSIPLLIIISKKLFFVLFLSVLLYLIVGIISSRIIYQRAYQNIEYEAEFNNALLEDINMINSTKNLNITDLRLKSIEEKLALYLKDNFTLTSFLNKESSIKNAINEICFFIINTWGFYLVYQGQLNITNLITFNTLLTIFLDPIKNCIDALPKYNFLKASYTKINDFLSVSKESLGDEEVMNNNDIVVNNLTFSYNKLDNIIDNLSFQIKPNSFVSLSGKSGSGKSTFCQILERYITDYQGEILIGGVNIKDYSIATIRNNITYVNQEESLITASIKDNIILGRDILADDFHKICEICEIEEIVLKKPLRYNTTIADASTNISGGEKQRIILARALLKDAKIIILDEALSEVDSKLETKIMNNIKKNFPDKTIIYISHKEQQNIYDDVIKIGGKYELS